MYPQGYMYPLGIWFSRHRLTIVFSKVGFPPSGSYETPFGRFICFLESYGGFVSKVISQNIDFTRPCLSCSPSSISPFRVRIKARLVDSYDFRRVMADSCQKLFLKTSISRDHAYRVLRRRFPPFGFVLKPVWSIHMFVGELLWICVKGQ